MADYENLPSPDSFPDLSNYSRAFDEFTALDYNKDITYEHQVSTPKNRPSKVESSFGEKQFGTPGSGNSNYVDESPPIDPQDLNFCLPSPEHFAEIEAYPCGRQFGSFAVSNHPGNVFTSGQNPADTLYQEPGLFDGSHGYVHHGGYDDCEVGNYNGQGYSPGAPDTTSSVNDLDSHQVQSPYYHTAELKLESPERNKTSTQASLNNGSPKRTARRTGSRAKLPYAQSIEEDFDDSGDGGDGDYVEEVETAVGQKDSKKVSRASQATRKFAPQIKSVDEYKRVLIAEEEKFQKLTTKAEGAQEKFPNSPAGQQACVAEIMAAIHNFEDIVDKTGKNGRAAQSHNRFEQGFYQRFEIEMKCWQLLIRIRDANTGNRLISKHIEDKYEVYENFRDRFDCVIRGLKQSKAMCKMMMDPAYIDRLAQAPSGEFKTKINNKKINGQRDVDNQRGRLAKKLGLDSAIDKAVMNKTFNAGPPASVPKTPSKNSKVPTITPSSRKRKTSIQSVDETAGDDPFSESIASVKKQRPPPRKVDSSTLNERTPQTPRLHPTPSLHAYSPIDFGSAGFHTPIAFPELMMSTPSKNPQITPARMSNMSLAGTPDGLPRFVHDPTTEDDENYFRT